MQGQLFCMHCISIVCMSNMGPLSRIVTPGQRKWKDYCVQVQCRCVPDASFGVCWVFSFADPWQHCLEEPSTVSGPTSWSRAITNTDAGQAALSNQHSETPKGSKLPPLWGPVPGLPLLLGKIFSPNVQAEIPVLQEQFPEAAFYKREGTGKEKRRGKIWE